MPAVEERVNHLEEAMRQLAYVQMNTQIGLHRLSEEMREFKDEMREFKDEMREFKDEMREFKDEMSEFKDEMREFQREMREDRRQLNRAWGDLANKLGTIIEDIVAPNIWRIARDEFGIEIIDDFFVRRQKRHPSKGVDGFIEFDVVCVGGGRVLLTESKSSPDRRDPAVFVEKMRKFPDFFPEYATLPRIGIFSSWSLSPQLRKAIAEAGLFGMAMGDETMVIVARPQ